MPQTRSERRLAAIMCADAVGFSRRMGTDETGTLHLLNSLREDVFDPLVAGHNGRVFKLTGDGALAEFGSVVDGVECALSIQRNLRDRNAGEAPERKMDFRIGINLGDVLFQGDDIYGDGVNVAARLEALAPPGGVALSGAVFRHLAGKVVTVFRDTGLRTLKNIVDPVHVYLWPHEAGGGDGKAVQAGTGLPVSGKPAICVRPFAYRGSAGSEDAFGDGIAEDIIYGISRYSGVDVIGRCSSFAERTRQMSVQELFEEIGARYVVDGSVRRSGDRVRISVELTESHSGLQLWANRYDRELADVFDVEDEIAEEIVAVLPGQILRAEADRVRRKPPEDMTAYDHVIAGRLCHHAVRPEENRRAQQHLSRAIELDPGYADAYAWKACTLGQSLEFGFAEDVDAIEEEAMAMIGKAMSLDENHLECHRLLAEVCIMTGKLDQAAVHNERARAMNSFDPRLLAQKGEILTWQGSAADGVNWISRAMELDPFGAPGRAHLLGNALLAAGRFEEAVRAYGMMPSPGYRRLAFTAASLALAGNIEEARRHAARVLQLAPDFSVRSVAAALPFAEKAQADLFVEGMKKAGLPD